MIDIRAILVAGHRAIATDRAIKEQAVRGHPRVGTSGSVADDAEVYGTCPRKALLRGMGEESEIKLHTDIMFKAGGEANEWHWKRILTAGLPDDLVRVDAEIDAEINGVPLTVLGHPDEVLGTTDGTPVLGMELKGVFGKTTAVSVIQGVPKNDNLIQAAAYSHFLKLPWALCYTSASYVSIPFNQRKEVADEYKDQFGNLLPFYRIFYMEWREGRLWYRDEMQTQWVPTEITPKGIEDYYRLVEEMKKRKDLGPRPSSHYVTGEQNKYGREAGCGLCEFRPACDAYDGDKNYAGWIERIRLITKQSSEESAA